MNDSVDSDNEPKLIDLAISGCENNIRRHTRATTIELCVVLMLLASLFGGIFSLATLQSQQNDAKNNALSGAVNEAFQEAESQRATLAVAQTELDRIADGPLSTESIRVAENKVAQLTATVKSAESRLDGARANVAAQSASPLLSDSLLYGAGAISIVLLGIFAGLYRAHLREITRNEHFRLGLMRIRIAAANAGRNGFGSEVRVALTHRAFELGVTERSTGRLNEVESPLPGHPSSDAATVILNRVLEQLEVVLKPRGDKQP